MNREQIIQMARDAGADEKYYGINMTPGMAFLNHEDLERFATAIRSAVKDEDAEICQFEHLSYPQDREDDAYDAAVNDCVAAIRASK